MADFGVMSSSCQLRATGGFRFASSSLRMPARTGVGSSPHRSASRGAGVQKSSLIGRKVLVLHDPYTLFTTSLSCVTVSPRERSSPGRMTGPEHHFKNVEVHR